MKNAPFRRPDRGFTLVELAIVLAVAGLLFTGLFRLLSGGNQQIKDSATASQHSQLISAAKSFLASTSGQQFLASNCTAGCTSATTPFALPLPLAATPAGNAACYGAADKNLTAMITAGTAQTWCSTLPSGFSAGSTNSYGQTYSIQIMVNSTTPANQPPSTYSFMVLTNGGDTISDTSGGRISGLIGGDGGFEYTAAVCGTGAANTACGAYGAWVVTITGANSFGFAADPGAGHVASRTYISPEQDANLPWLSRIKIPSDMTTPPTYNTMSTNMWLNAIGTSAAAPNTLYGTNDFVTSGGTSFGGKIYGINGIIAGMNPTDTNSAITINDNTGVCPNGANDFSGGVPASVTIVGGVPTTTLCNTALQVNGNQAVTGLLEANIIWAGYVYNAPTSDLRLKKDIKPLDDGLQRVMQLKPVTYRFKQDNREDMGFIAQDLQKIYPQIVMGRPDGVLGVNYNGLLAPLVSSVQELKKENDVLREQMRVQEARIKKLERNASSSRSP